MVSHLNAPYKLVAIPEHTIYGGYILAHEAENPPFSLYVAHSNFEYMGNVSVYGNTSVYIRLQLILFYPKMARAV